MKRNAASALAVLFAFLSLPVTAAEQPSGKQPTPLVIDGKILESSIHYFNGNPFVDLNKLGGELGWKIQASPSVVIVESAAGKKVDPSGLKAGSGTIAGTITYYFNNNFGEKPDVGSKVFLLRYEEGFYLSEDDYPVLTSTIAYISRAGEKVDYPVVASTSVDGNGRYELKGIPSGKYSLIIKSAHSKGSSKKDIGGKVLFRKIDIGSDSYVDISNDFGTTSF